MLGEGLPEAAVDVGIRWMNLEREIGALYRIEEVEADGKEIPEATVIVLPENARCLKVHKEIEGYAQGDVAEGKGHTVLRGDHFKPPGAVWPLGGQAWNEVLQATPAPHARHEEGANAKRSFRSIGQGLQKKLNLHKNGTRRVMHVNEKITSRERRKKMPILDGPIDVEAALVARPAASILIVAQVAADASLRGKKYGFARDSGVKCHIAMEPQWGEQGARTRDEERAAVDRAQ